MYLASLSLLNFKNYEECSVSFSPFLNVFTGPNGSGKTNLLDGIHFLCLTKSAFQSNDSNAISHNVDFMMIKGTVLKEDKKYVVQAGLKKGQKKVFQLNKKPYEKISDHIGSFPAVIITPYDTDLIREGSEVRRKFIDGIISQTDHEYLLNLLKYSKVLKQRNALLKSFAEKRNFDRDLLSGYDIPLIELAKKIYRKRKLAMETFLPLFQKHYLNISGGNEEVAIHYKSDLEKNEFEKHFEEAQQKDLILQRTTKGIHKDDYGFDLGKHPIKNTGSQGQQKSFVISLKMAQFEFIHSALSQKPILLLDDIFDKLDQSRIKKLLHMITENTFGQVFITEAGQDRVEKFMDNFPGEKRTFSIKDGKVENIT